MPTAHASLSDGELYERDFYAWTQRQAAALQGRHWHDLDIDNLAEELADLGVSVRRAIESRLDIMIGHLIKLAVSQDRDPRRGWWNTVRIQRGHIDNLLAENPSLRPRFVDLFARQWRFGVGHARVGLREDEADRIADFGPWITPEQAMTVDDDDELRALVPRAELPSPAPML